MSARFSLRLMAAAFVLFGAGGAWAQELPSLAGLPGPLHMEGKATAWKVGDGGVFALSSGPKSDWFAWPGGGHNPESSPRLLFKAAADFTFSTRVTVDSRSIYDAGCIALHGTPSAWAKFCLEAQADSQLAVVSVVTRKLSDDATAFLVAGNSHYLRVAKTGSVIFLYASADGKKWTIVRKFNLDLPDGLQVGFAVQSPEGKGATAVFSDYRYGKGAVDPWKLD